MNHSLLHKMQTLGYAIKTFSYINKTILTCKNLKATYKCTKYTFHKNNQFSIYQTKTHIQTISTATQHPISKMGIIKKDIKLTNEESKLFKVLMNTIKHHKLNVTLRCAGGWVRDKLLGKDSLDIDIALDTMMGKEFAEKVNDYLMSLGEEVHRIAVIETNPEQSKHLETARLNIHSLMIDLVNLRSETYTIHNRIPTVKFGTPTQDAYRRDFTINSMFYNINQKIIEDFTDNGLNDLDKGIIRTPLKPHETLLDDPLRVLRAVRFSARFGFQLEEELKESCMSDEVKKALMVKVSRERIGIEVTGMFKCQDPVGAMKLLEELSLFEITFKLPDKLNHDNYSKPCIHMISAAFELLNDLNDKIALNEEEKRLILLAAMLLPLRETEVKCAKNKRKRIEASRISAIIIEGLKWRSKDADIVKKLHANAPLLLNIEQKEKRVKMGLCLRNLKEYWKSGVILAALSNLPESVSLFSNNEDTVEESNLSQIELFDKINSTIIELNLENVYQLKPLLDGKEVIKLVKMKKGGPILGTLMESQIEWQLANPSNSADDLKEFLKLQYDSLITDDKDNTQ